MPSLETLLVFTAAALLMNISPGPSNLYVMSRAMTQGAPAGIVAAFGLGAGSLVHVAAAALGLSAVFVYSPLAYAILKYAGAAYLVWLGLRMLFARGGLRSPTAHAHALPLARIFTQSVVVEVLNPKTALFFLAFLPQFVDPAAGPVPLQVLVLGSIVTATALPCDFAVAFAAGGAARFLRANPWAVRAQTVVSGSILVGLGAWIVVARRGAD